MIGNGGRGSSKASKARCVLIGLYNKAEIDGFFHADGAALIDGAECAAGFVATTVDLDASTGKEIGDGGACATGQREVGLTFSAKSLTIPASSLGKDELALYPRSMKKAGE